MGVRHGLGGVVGFVSLLVKCTSVGSAEDAFRAFTRCHTTRQNYLMMGCNTPILACFPASPGAYQLPLPCRLVCGEFALLSRINP